MDRKSSIKQGIRSNLKDYFDHKANASNPHKVNASQVGLGNANNTKDTDKPVSTAQQAALNLKQNTALSDSAALALGLPAGTSVEDALIAVSRKKDFIINMETKLF